MLEKITFDILHKFYFQFYKMFFFKKYRKNMSFRRKIVSRNEASLTGFDNLNCIFVHIPKTAGISITNALFQNMGGSHRSLRNYLNYFNNNDFNNYYKFCFVRNPWDRLVSSYFFLKGGGMNEGDNKWAKKHLRDCDNFEDFVLNYLHKKDILNYIHFKPQYQFIVINNKIFVDKVYRFENIPSAIDDISNILNVEVKIERKNVSKKRDGYKQYYSEVTKDIVYELYKKDIITFDYKF